ncbi:MAG TPA: SLC13 family permease [Elusimicrobiota bacterium]|nr:SLC13 family permease [Elusimicrobiota bacterium]
MTVGIALTLLALAVSLAAIVREEFSTATGCFIGSLILLLGGVVTTDDFLRAYSNEASAIIAALFIVAGALQATGLLQPIAIRLLTGVSPATACLRLLLITFVVGLWVNNTVFVAIMLPVILKLEESHGTPASKLLIPLSFGKIIAGMGTLIGTSTNVIVSGLMTRGHVAPLGFFEPLPLILPGAAASIAFFWAVGHRLLPDRAGERAKRLDSVRQYQFELAVAARSPLIGRAVADVVAELPQNTSLAGARRGERALYPDTPRASLALGDVLRFTGTPVAMEAMLSTLGLAHFGAERGDGGDSQLLEVILPKDSSFIGRDPRSVFVSRAGKEIEVVGVQRAGGVLSGDLGAVSLRAGDMLLLHASPESLRETGAGRDYFVLSYRPRVGAGLTPRKALVLGIFLAMVIAAATGVLSMVKASMTAALVLVLTGSIDGRRARKLINLKVLMLVGASLVLSQAMEKTGLAEIVGRLLLRGAGSSGAIGGLAMLYLATMLFTELGSNNAVAAIMYPIGVKMAAVLGADPRGFIMAVMIAASAGFVIPMGYQTHLMVMQPGGYKMRDFVRAGLPIDLIFFVSAVAMIAWRYGI